MELKNYKEGKNIVASVENGSIAQELGIEKGDEILSINETKVVDVIDYKFLISDELLVLKILKPNGEEWDFEIEKDYSEDLGIVFTNPLIDKAKSCKNKCMFCFIDQLPPNMRDTLYFKDDDSRLSFLQGNFITLTNMDDNDIERIIKYRLSPINVSVHTTNPELRIKMLKNKNAGKIFDILKRFHKANLDINCQIVLVPGINDKDELNNTLHDLSSLYPSVNSVAIVPIGLTKYRDSLDTLKQFDFESANAVLSQIKAMQKTFLKALKTRFVFAADEFYILAGAELPDEVAYEGYPQYENGVGLVRSFEREIEKSLNRIKTPYNVNNRSIIFATGQLAKNFIDEVATKIMNTFRGLRIDTVGIENNFFGKTITVSGLVTGNDLINQLRAFNESDVVFIPSSMMKHNEELFLDDVTIKEVEKALNKRVIIVPVDGKELINAIREEVL